jgi:hypothetical protein
MGDPIKIVVTAETAEAAAKLQAFLKTGSAGLTAMGAEAATAAEKVGHMGGAMYGLRSSIDAVRYAAMDGGPRAAFYAVDEGVRALVASGLGLAVLGPIILGVGAAAAAAYIGWKQYMVGAEDTTKANEALVASLDKVPAILEKIDNQRKAGLITAAAAKEFAGYLGQNPKNQLYRQVDENGQPTGQLGPQSSATITVSKPSVNLGAFPEQQTINQNLQKASPEEANAWVQK